MKTDHRKLAQAFPSAAARQAQSAAARFRVLGVRVDAVQTHDFADRMEAWIAERAGCHFIGVARRPTGTLTEAPYLQTGPDGGFLPNHGAKISPLLLWRRTRCRG